MRGILIAAIVLAASRADAYPQFQFVMGAKRCNECHYAPAGGGLLNAYGRDVAADEVSGRGDGAFLHGVWEPPSWLSLGGDVRGAALAGSRAGPAAFPMQVDLYLRAALGPVSAYVNGGLRGSVRGEGEAGTIALSREHYLMWRPGPTGPYARAGRFFPPYGLRLAEHVLYVRRYLGMNTLEETYGVSGGWVTDGWEAHASGFLPDPLLPPIGDEGPGIAATVEIRITDDVVVGGQGKASLGEESRRYMGGVTAKLVVPGTNVLLLGQLDLARQHLVEVMESYADRDQLSGLVGASWMFLPGLLGDVFLQHWSADLEHTRNDRDGVLAQLHWFPWAHVEIVVSGQAEVIGAGEGGPTSGFGLLQLHYYP